MHTDQSRLHERDAAQVIQHLKGAAMFRDATTQPWVIKPAIRPHSQIHYLTILRMGTRAVSTETAPSRGFAATCERRELGVSCLMFQITFRSVFL